jgi:hypothetical protein
MEPGSFSYVMTVLSNHVEGTPLTKKVRMLALEHDQFQARAAKERRHLPVGSAIAGMMGDYSWNTQPGTSLCRLALTQAPAGGEGKRLRSCRRRTVLQLL